MSDHDIGNSPLGEHTSTRKYYRGDPPAKLPAPVRVGSEDCIASGEDPGTVTELDRNPRCQRMQPNACYADVQALLDDTDPKSCAWAYSAALILDAQYNDMAAAKDLARGFFGEDFTLHDYPVENTIYPNTLIALDVETCFVFVTGTTNFQQLALQGLYFGLGPQDKGSFSCSNLYWDAADKILQRMNDAGAFSCKRFVFAGHSYGGAICCVAAVKKRLANQDLQVEIVTFGCPKPGDERLALQLRTVPGYHYANHGDPIPFTPPQGTLFDTIRSILGPAAWFNWTKFVRPDVIATITEDHKIIFEDAADFDDSAEFLIATAVAANEVVPFFDDHAMHEYTLAIKDACPCTQEIVPVEENPPPDPNIQPDNYRLTVEDLIVSIAGTLITINQAWDFSYLGGNRYVNNPPDWESAVLVYGIESPTEEITRQADLLFRIGATVNGHDAFQLAWNFFGFGPVDLTLTTNPITYPDWLTIEEPGSVRLQYNPPDNSHP